MAAVEEQSSFAAPPPESASIDELRSALHESLDQRGVLGRIRAQSRLPASRAAPRPPRARPPARRLREEIFHAVDAGADAPKPGDAPVETLVVEELVREYLAFAGYGHALSVFAAEASLPGRDDARLGRAHLAESLGLCQDAASRELPLLFGLVATLQDQQAAARER